MMTATDRQPQRLTLRNELADLSELSRWIEAHTERDVSSDMAFAVALCLEEAVANIIMHSGDKNDRVEITVELARDREALTARIEDNGKAFDPTQIPPPSPATSLREAKVGDVGIHLMRSFASEMRYRRHGDRNELTLRFLEAKTMPSG